METINIVIVDDHSIVRQGIKQIIELEENMRVVGEAINGEEAVELICELKPHIALMDINMPKLNGIGAIKKLKEAGCPSKIIVLTIHADKEYLTEAIQLGACGYILKEAEASVLIDTINKVFRGETYIPSNLATELIREYGRTPSNDNKLTEREIEVLKYIAEGATNKEISAKLYISEKTVKNHISSIFRKLNIYDRTQAAIFAIRHGIK